MQIPASRLVFCSICRAPLDSSDKQTYKYGSGWIHGRSVTLAEYSGIYACKWCIDGRKKGLPDGQLRLFDS